MHRIILNHDIPNLLELIHPFRDLLQYFSNGNFITVALSEPPLLALACLDLRFYILQDSLRGLSFGRLGCLVLIVEVKVFAIFFR